MPGKSGFGAARQATHIHIQQVKAGFVVMPKALAVGSVDQIQRLLQLSHILGCAGIQGLLHDRLLGTGRPSEGPLQATISSQAGIDLHHPMGSSQQADESISELVDWRMLDGFLLNLHLRTDWTKEIQLTQFHSYGGQTGRRCKMLRCLGDTLVHGDAPSHASWFYFFHEIRVITFLLSLASSSFATNQCG